MTQLFKDGVSTQQKLFAIRDIEATIKQMRDDEYTAWRKVYVRKLKQETPINFTDD